MKKGYLYIILCAALFSTIEIALKVVSNQFNSLQISFLRFLSASILLFPLALKNLKTRELSLSKDDFKFFLLTGFINIIVSMTFYQLAILYSKASTVAILFSCNPVFTVPLASLILDEKINKQIIISLAICMLGMICIINPFNMVLSFKGAIFTIIAALTFALYAVISKKKCEKFGSLAVTCFSFIAGSLEMLIFILITKLNFVANFFSANGLSVFAKVPIFHGITLNNIFILAYISIFVTGLGYTFYFLAMEETSASTASITFFIKPALAPILALIILKEAINLNIIIGIIFIIAGSIFNFITANEPVKIRDYEDDSY